MSVTTEMDYITKAEVLKYYEEIQLNSKLQTEEFAKLLSSCASRMTKEANECEKKIKHITSSFEKNILKKLEEEIKYINEFKEFEQSLAKQSEIVGFCLSELEEFSNNNNKLTHDCEKHGKNINSIIENMVKIQKSIKNSSEETKDENKVINSKQDEKINKLEKELIELKNQLTNSEQDEKIKLLEKELTDNQLTNKTLKSDQDDINIMIKIIFFILLFIFLIK